jgi:protein-S-isoprenylcysteine O-methyltransferase Ste14
MADESVFRNACILILVPVAVIGVYHRIKARTAEKLDRRQEGLVRMIALRVCGFSMWIGMWAYLIYPPSMAWAQAPLPEWLRWAGLPFGLVAAPLFYWQMSSLGRNLTDTVVTRANATLVTHGPYRWVRHPLYTISVLLVVSFALLAASWFIAAAWVVGFSILVSRTRIEEQKLIERFGDEYRQYMRRTGRFLPRLGP